MNFFKDLCKPGEQPEEGDIIPLGQNNMEPSGNSGLNYISFTLSADPKMKVTRSYEFHELSPSDQKGIYFHLLKDLFLKYKNKMGFKIMVVHYELDKSGKIHCHGYVDIKESIRGYEVNLLELSSYCHKKIGRKGNNKKISSRFEYPLNGIEKYKEYCNKSNDLKPSKIKSTKIIDYIK